MQYLGSLTAWQDFFTKFTIVSFRLQKACGWSVIDTGAYRWAQARGEHFKVSCEEKKRPKFVFQTTSVQCSDFMGRIKLSKFAALQFCSHCYPDAVSVVLPDMYLSMGQNQSITCFYHSDKTDVLLSRHDDLGFARRPYFLSV